MKELMDRTLRLVKNQIMLSGVELEKNVENDLPAIKGKPHDLVQAFLNIVINAIQAMDESGTLTIETCQGPAGYNQINITDTGAGIKPADMNHIFDPFYTTKTVGEGTGLGLSLVYGIIRSHGGYIEVNSKLGKGTTFAIFLPTAEKMNQDKADQDKTNRDKQDETKTCHC
jgi:signal transduction histidine kinase